MNVFLPSWKSEGSSLVRLNELSEIEQITGSFKKHNLTFPEKLHSALMIPQDKPLACTTINMPNSGAGLMVDPVKKGKKSKIKGGRRTKSIKKKKK